MSAHMLLLRLWKRRRRRRRGLRSVGVHLVVVVVLLSGELKNGIALFAYVRNGKFGLFCEVQFLPLACLCSPACLAANGGGGGCGGGDIGGTAQSCISLLPI
ncbi:hypothetical protein BT93_C0089 [Corymbia citriodora subsp. variegata]|nr:hypothetical protein BT93_C0089 [Corymbia citriodora subsp. variegata]